MVPGLADLVNPAVEYFAVLANDRLRFGWISMITSIAFMNAGLVLGLAKLEDPSYTATAWHLTLTIWAIVVLQAAVNVFAYSLLPVFEIGVSVLHVVLFVVVIVIFGTMGEKHSAKYVFTDFVTSSGWDDGFVSFNVGMLPFIWGCKSIINPFEGED